jgi:hypothetical protein
MLVRHRRKSIPTVAMLHREISRQLSFTYSSELADVTKDIIHEGSNSGALST